MDLELAMVHMSGQMSRFEPLVPGCWCYSWRLWNPLDTESNWQSQNHSSGAAGLLLFLSFLAWFLSSTTVWEFLVTLHSHHVRWSISGCNSAMMDRTLWTHQPNIKFIASSGTWLLLRRAKKLVQGLLERNGEERWCCSCDLEKNHCTDKKKNENYGREWQRQRMQRRKSNRFPWGSRKRRGK